MAKQRILKPEFWTSEQIAQLSFQARLAFIGMWSFSDDGGFHPANYVRLKMEVFPADNVDTESLVQELLNAGLIETTVSDGVSWWYVTGWHKHQYIQRPFYRCSLSRSISAQAKLKLSSSSVEIGEKTKSKSKSKTKTNSILSPAKAGNGSHYSDQFAEFWSAYPPGRKSKKQKAWKAYQRAAKATDHATILAACQEYAASDEGKGEYVKMPETWLNGHCWEDDRSAWSATKAVPINRVLQPEEYHLWNPHSPDGINND